MGNIERSGWLAEHPLKGGTVHVVTREWFDAMRELYTQENEERARLADQLRGAVKALEAFALDKWGTTNPILVTEDEKPLQEAYYAATRGQYDRAASRDQELRSSDDG